MSLAAQVRDDVAACQYSMPGVEFHWIDGEITLSHPATSQIFQQVLRWLECCSHEDATWAQRRCGVPSLMIKVDCAVEPDGQQLRGIYEIDDSPDGIGIAQMVNAPFASRLARLRRQWPHFRSLALHHRITDDHLWLEEPLSLETLDKYDGLLLIRGEPQQPGMAHLAERSVSTCALQGSKAYGVTLGWWQPVTAPDQINWEDEVLILKSPYGRGGWGVHIRCMRGGFESTSGRPQILEALNRDGLLYRQPFIVPMTCPFFPDRLMVLQAFFGFNLQTQQYQYLGGLWVARRDSLKITIAPDAIVGPLI